MSPLDGPSTSARPLPMSERGGWARDLIRPFYAGYYNHRHAKWAEVEDTSFVSFTFDDFPSSALNIGGKIIAEMGATATFYATSGPGSEELYSKQDLETLLSQGHELGCHTHSHLRAGYVSGRAFERDVVRNISALERMAPGQRLRSFSYPFGATNLRTQRRLSRYFTSGRGTVGGINRGRFDLNHLRANRVNSRLGNRRALEELIDVAANRGGWLLFYTHDVSSEPSQFGCTPRDLEALASHAARSGAALRTVGQVVASLRQEMLDSRARSANVSRPSPDPDRTTRRSPRTAPSDSDHRGVDD